VTRLSRIGRRTLLAAAALGWAATTLAGPVFPVQYSANRRYLTDRFGTPFPILGRTAWFVLSLTPADYRIFIDDTASRGFTAIETHVVNHDPRGNHPPFDGDGNRPFVSRIDGTAWDGSLTGYRSAGGAPDFTTPNEKYWRGVDAFLAYCESRNIVVFMFPAYLGKRDNNQGWVREVVANGPARMQSYGAWLARRYRSQRNLVWMMGGDMGTAGDDFNAAETSAERGLFSGLASISGQQSVFFSAEWTTESIATDQPHFGASMTLNGAYSWSGDVVHQGRRAYAHEVVEPALLLEEPYDEEGPDGNRVNPSAIQPVRRFEWGGWLSTIGGYIAGNGYVWRFRDATWRDRLTNIRTALRAPDRHWPGNGPGWRAHLDTQGSRDLARLNAFVTSISWYNLVPSGLGGMRTLITRGGSSDRAADYVPAAAAPDGALLVAYVPPAHQGAIEVNMRALAGPTRARWFDPTNGAYVTIGDNLSNTGSRSFATPGPNGAGAADWVLVMTAQLRRPRQSGSVRSQ
jgi:Protein of unknown function (DUF4038)/Putative collagen-binding domain of a collagenase